MCAPYRSAPITTVHCCRNGVISVWKRNDSIRFFVSGLIGNVAFFGLDKALLPVVSRVALRLSASDKPYLVQCSKSIGKNATSVSFFVAYLVDIALMRESRKSQERDSCTHSTSKNN